MRTSHLVACSTLLLVFLAGTSMDVLGQEKAGTTVLKKFGSFFKNSEKPEPGPVRMPRNSVDSPSDAITPTGARLTPFGNPNYWGRQPEVSVDDDLALLPPMPDLRTPDQISPAERKRNFRIAKYAKRHQANLDRQAEIDALIASKMPQPQADPSTALIQVESKKGQAADYGRRERPDTIKGSLLKPFNRDSTYYEGGEVKYTWTNHEFVETTPDPSEDELLGLLPPLPDLRTPDQVSGSEKRRNFRIAKFARRQQRNDAKRQENIDAIEAKKEEGEMWKRLNEQVARGGVQ